MKKLIKNILPYLIVSILVIVFWKVWTMTSNYAFSPVGKELLMLDIALTSIFIYKGLFWLFLANLTVFAFRQLKKRNFKTSLTVIAVIVLFYFIAGNFVDKKCAFHYYSVFHNQSTKEDLLTRPLIEGGYHVGPFLVERIRDKSMENRIYAISAIGEIKYKPATTFLDSILNDSTESEYIRAEAYNVLELFNTKESRNIIEEFEVKANTRNDKKVLELFGN